MIPKREAQDQKQRRSRRHGWTADHVKIHCPLEAHSVGLVGRQPHEADVDSIIVSRGTQRAPGDNGGIGEGLDSAGLTWHENPRIAVVEHVRRRDEVCTVREPGKDPTACRLELRVVGGVKNGYNVPLESVGCGPKLLEVFPFRSRAKRTRCRVSSSARRSPNAQDHQRPKAVE